MWTSNNKACWEVQKQTCSVPTGFSAALSLTLMDKKLRWAVSSLISLYPVSADIRCAAHSKWVDLQMPFAQLVHASRGSDTQMSTVVSHNHLWSLITLQLLQSDILASLFEKMLDFFEHAAPPSPLNENWVSQSHLTVSGLQSIHYLLAALKKPLSFCLKTLTMTVWAKPVGKI